MNLTEMNLFQQAILTASAMVMFMSFLLLSQSRVISTIHTFAAQSVLIVLITGLVAIEERELHLAWSALLTLVLKVIFIPWLLHRIARKFRIQRAADIMYSPALVMLAGGAIAIFCYYIALPIERYIEGITRPIVAISMTTVMLGFLILITRSKAISQVIGFMAIENGLFLAAVSATQGMPMIVEIGVAFDVLVAAIIFGVFFFQMKESFDSFDVDHLNQLSEGDA
ncbi:MAG: formate hydrogenlyase [Gammaproteobacteria bacterium]|nr:MAG: formate hydrogenlyase [Gammaproteobacteria bacterium]